MHLGLISRYDGNLIGGILLGVGMAFAGACPGTVLSQVAVGAKSGFYALGGALIGGVVWTGLVKPYLSRWKPTPVTSETKTWHEGLLVSRTAVFLGSVAVYTLVVVATLFLTVTGASQPISGVVGGLLIGGAQLFSLISRGRLVGVSTCYEEVGDWFWWMVDADKNRPKGDAILFSTGLMGGAWALSYLMPSSIVDRYNRRGRLTSFWLLRRFPHDARRQDSWRLYIGSWYQRYGAALNIKLDHYRSCLSQWRCSGSQHILIHLCVNGAKDTAKESSYFISHPRWQPGMASALKLA